MKAMNTMIELICKDYKNLS